MLIIINGTRSAGKSTLEDYLCTTHGFTRLKLIDVGKDTLEAGNTRLDLLEFTQISTALDQMNFLTNPSSPPITSPPNGTLSSSEQVIPSPEGINIFDNSTQLLNHVTRRWQENFVVQNIDHKDTLELLLKRPFSLLITVDAPILLRFSRYQNQNLHSMSLENFVQEHDEWVYRQRFFGSSSLHGLAPPCYVNIINPYTTIPEFYEYLKCVDLLNPERLRPEWDTYFMTLASLASLRSNCMKRRVGALLVVDYRIVSTGYNGTPRGLTNCNEGGCPRCNQPIDSRKVSSEECLCLHAEENALLEAGRDRIGNNAVLYCNTCPCLKCTVKIIQSGVREVVYNLAYKMDLESARVFKEKGIILRQYTPPR